MVDDRHPDVGIPEVAECRLQLGAADEDTVEIRIEGFDGRPGRAEPRQADLHAADVEGNAAERQALESTEGIGEAEELHMPFACSRDAGTQP